MVKLIFIDGLDRTGKSTMINLINQYYSGNEKFDCKIVVAPSSEFRESLLWKSIGNTEAKDWNINFVTKWAKEVTTDLYKQIKTTYDILDKAKKCILLVDRGFISTIAYQGAMLLTNLNNKNNFMNIEGFYDLQNIYEVNLIIKNIYDKWKEIVKNNVYNICGYEFKNIGDDIKSNYYLLTDQITTIDMEGIARNNSSTDSVFENDLEPMIKNMFYLIKEDYSCGNYNYICNNFSLYGNLKVFTPEEFEFRFMHIYNNILSYIDNGEN